MEQDSPYFSSLASLREEIRSRINAPLPGDDARSDMQPEHRKRLQFKHNHSAAVLIALMKGEEGVEFPLIERVDDGMVHGGQVGLPGGKIEKGETVYEAALREAWEEIGLEANNVEVLGQLTPLEIPVSSFLVHPVIGVVRTKFDYRLSEMEVRRLFTVRLDMLFQEELKCIETRTFKGQPVEVPYYDLHGRKVWGATAMILTELAALLS